MLCKPQFTKEQEHWICGIIGDWYLHWKDKIADYEGKTNNLGYAKEELKTLIFTGMREITKKEFEIATSWNELISEIEFKVKF